MQQDAEIQYCGIKVDDKKDLNSSQIQILHHNVHSLNINYWS
jgi:hypothetical protein